MDKISLLNFVVSAIMLIVLLGVSKESLRRISKVINVLTAGSYLDCPHCKKFLVVEGSEEETESIKKGGESYEGNSSSKG